MKAVLKDTFLNNNEPPYTIKASLEKITIKSGDKNFCNQ